MAFLWLINGGYYLLTNWDDPPSGDHYLSGGHASFQGSNRFHDSQCARYRLTMCLLYASDPEFMKRIVTVNVEMKWNAGLTKTNDVNNINH